MPFAQHGGISRDVLTGISITCIIFAVSVYMPIFGFFCSLFIPLPILFYRSKLGRKTGAIIPVAAGVIMMMVLGRFSIDLLFFFELMLLGFILSELMEIDLSIEKTVLFACGAILASAIVGLVFYSQIIQKGLTDVAAEYVTKNLQLTLLLYESMGMSEENIQLIASSLEHIQYVLLRIIPALAIASTLFVAWTSLLISRPLLKSRGLYYPDFGPLNLWKPPEHLVWGVIGCGLVLLIPSGSVKLIGLNGLIMLMAVYFFTGIAIVSFYFERKRFPRLLRIFLYSLIALQQFVLILVIGLGFFDVWLNFRKIKPPNTQQS
ncbi:MAG TPA: YybS family protein [Deltaproteobacteria bacterium]|nr:YybS family protein [Deltaproteobacteria bacterium]